MVYEKEIPFGAFNSELMHQEISIPEGFEASIDGNKIILTRIESKDEKIRKELIEHIKANRIADYVLFKKFSSDDVIAWLEKQSKQTSSQTNERAWLYLVADVLTWKDGIGQYLDDPRVQELAKKLCREYAQKLYNSSVLSNSSNTGNNNQKPTNEVKPKFKVGDWIVTPTNEVLHVTSIERTRYVFNNQSSYWETYYCDKKCHLWTIQDAKDGDVLCFEIENEFIVFIYKNGHVHYHCSYHNGNLITIDSFFVIPKYLLCYIHPATKEQCNLLFQKIEETGYEWDAEKKELNEIKHKI